jgi:hypothetical protein
VRFALLHHVVSRIGQSLPDDVPIRAESIESGIVLARWFADEAERVYGALGESDGQREHRQLVEWIAANGGSATARDVQRSDNRKYKTTADTQQTLDALVTAGLGAWKDAPQAGRGRPARVFTIGEPHDANADCVTQKILHDTIQAKTPEKQALPELCRAFTLSCGGEDAAPDGMDFDYGGEQGDPEEDCSPERFGLVAPPVRCQGFSPSCQCDECKLERCIGEKEGWLLSTPHSVDDDRFDPSRNPWA